MALAGAFETKMKDGTVYYRSSFTYKGRHISLGSFPTEKAANKAYKLANKLVIKGHHFYTNVPREIVAYPNVGTAVSFEKWVMLLNLRDNHMYCRNAIYLQHRFFYYCLDPETTLRFDIEELFYYMNRKIQKRGGHLFVADYGMQVNILSRYGIKNYAVIDKDYRFINGDIWDFRSGNVEIINPYHGVSKTFFHDETLYVARIHVNGDFIVGRYKTAEEAATAYNKAADFLDAHGFEKDFPRNYIESYSDVEYAAVYQRLRINKRLKRRFTEGQ